MTDQISKYYPSAAFSLALMFSHDGGDFLESLVARDAKIMQTLLSLASKSGMTGLSGIDAADRAPASIKHNCTIFRQASLVAAKSQLLGRDRSRPPLCQHINRQITYSCDAITDTIRLISPIQPARVSFGVKANDY